MRTGIALLLVSMSLLPGPAGCRQGSSDGKGKAMMAQELSLTAADNGGTRSAVVGQEVAVPLEETPATGYLWTLGVMPPEAVTEVSSEWLAPGTAGGHAPAVGGAGVRRFHLRLQAPGEVRLQATLARPWESGAAPLARYDVTLQVKSK